MPLNKSIKYFKKFHQLFEDKGKQPKQIDEGNLEAYMLAHFCLARLYSKIIPQSNDILISCLTESCKEYQWLIDFSKDNDIKVMQTEIEICKQMVELLPMKISAIRRGVITNPIL